MGLFGWFLEPDHAPAAAPGRSPRWPAVRRLHLAAEPTCRACGRRKSLQVHHVLPFHVFPQLELEDSNLVTLCESAGSNCHFVHGHALDWRGWNGDVLTDADSFRARVARSQILGEGKP